LVDIKLFVFGTLLLYTHTVGWLIDHTLHKPADDKIFSYSAVMSYEDDLESDDGLAAEFYVTNSN